MPPDIILSETNFVVKLGKTLEPITIENRKCARNLGLLFKLGRLYWQRLVSTSNRILAETPFYEVSANIVHKQEELLVETPKNLTADKKQDG